MSEFVYLIKSLINQHDQFQKAVKPRMPDEEAASNPHPTKADEITKNRNTKVFGFMVF